MTAAKKKGRPRLLSEPVQLSADIERDQKEVLELVAHLEFEYPAKIVRDALERHFQAYFEDHPEHAKTLEAHRRKRRAKVLSTRGPKALAWSDVGAQAVAGDVEGAMFIIERSLPANDAIRDRLTDGGRRSVLVGLAALTIDDLLRLIDEMEKKGIEPLELSIATAGSVSTLRRESNVVQLRRGRKAA